MQTASTTIKTNSIDRLIEQTIPIYTNNNPHPVKKRKDCAHTAHYKQLCRSAMRAAMAKATTPDQKNAVVEEFKEKVKAL